MSPTPIELAAAAIFVIAVAHTFSTSLFEKLAHRYPRHAGVLHLLGEVEVVFGFWALVLVLVMFALTGSQAAIGYVGSRSFTEPLFVFAVMLIAGSRPILQLSTSVVDGAARLLPVARPVATYFLALSLIPLLGSFITEPAAMTLGALMLRDGVFTRAASERFKYATIGVLFVNVSIGGTLMPYAAPPVLMVAAKWGWDPLFMLSTFGWRAALAVTASASIMALLSAREVRRVAGSRDEVRRAVRVPWSAMLACTLFLLGTVAFSHQPAVFLGILLCFLGYCAAFARHHDALIFRESMLVACFLAGLVVLGGLQAWWLQPLLKSMTPATVYYGATALTAITDNAALTYLGSLVDGLSDAFKVSLVAGAVTGGGLTVIANAPNPAGVAILRGSFAGGSVAAGWLFIGALGPTLVAIVAFRWL